jgi:hypothetical protein
MMRDQLMEYVVLRHEERPGINSGTPDVSISGNRKDSWWEVKYAHPSVRSRGVQELAMRKLAATSHSALYIIYEEKKDVRRTLIVHPRWLHELDNGEWTNDFDHQWVIDFIRKIHES